MIFGEQDPKHNNLYKGTENYADVIVSSIDPKFLDKTICYVFKIYKNTQFVFGQINLSSWQKTHCGHKKFSQTYNMRN